VDAAERAEARKGILEEILGLFRAAYAWETWGRLLVHVALGDDGRAVVVDVAVEDIVGDEARLERAFQGPEVRGSLAAVARAVEALVALDGIELEPLGGGTFIRTHDGALAFLPGLVRSPSLAFDRERDALVSRVRAKNDALRSAFGVGADAKVVPPPAGTVARARVKRAGAQVATADAVVLGTYSRLRRTFAWASENPSLDEAARRACVALLDAMPERSAWEVSTFAFATDEPTAWALAAWIVDAQGFDGLTVVEADDGVIYVALRDVKAEPAS
jgi:hypothetical protein